MFYHSALIAFNDEEAIDVIGNPIQYIRFVHRWIERAPQEVET